jgi:sulfite exporter TauE/SafE
MASFWLGTLPMLLSAGAVTSALLGKLSLSRRQGMIRAAHALVIVIAAVSALARAAVPPSPAAQTQDVNHASLSPTLRTIWSANFPVCHGR